MRPQEAIDRLSRALALLNETPIDKESIRTLTLELADEKHRSLIERGLASNDRALIIHGLMGALGHYETEKEQEQKRIHFTAHD